MFFHFVNKGDTLTKLSKVYKVPINRLIDDNNLKEPYLLVVGECLIIRKREITYTIKENDTLEKIANDNFISIDKILKDNNLKNNSLLQVGKKLIVSHENNQKIPFFINGFAYQGTNANTLKNTLPSLTHLSPFSHRFDNDGNLIQINDQEILEKIKFYEKKAILTIANLKENGGFSTSLVSKLLNEEKLQQTLISSLKLKIKEENYDSLLIDFEYINPEDKDKYILFLQKIKDSITNKLYVALAPKYSDEQKGLLYTAHDYFEIGKIADYVLLMTYEWGYSYGEPMAVAPLNKVKQVIRYAKSKIDKEKIIMGIPNYGYDWTLPFKKGDKANSLSNEKAMDLARIHKSEIEFDPSSKTPYFYYKEEGKSHIVHFDNPCSFNFKINLALDEELHGISIWTVSTYYPQLYQLLNFYFKI